MSKAVPLDAAKKPSPEYVAVIVSGLPTGAVVALHEPVPPVSGAVQSVVEPDVKVTVPVGVPDAPPLGATVAMYRTDVPDVVDVGLTDADVVEVAKVGAGPIRMSACAPEAPDPTAQHDVAPERQETAYGLTPAGGVADTQVVPPSAVVKMADPATCGFPTATQVVVPEQETESSVGLGAGTLC